MKVKVIRLADLFLKVENVEKVVRYGLALEYAYNNYKIKNVVTRGEEVYLVVEE